MVFESQIQRIYLTRLTCSFIPALLISLVVGIIFSSSIEWFFLIFIITQSLFIIRKILQESINFIFLLLDEKHAKENIYQILKKNNFPLPSQYELSSADYFKNIYESKNLDIQIRLIAKEIFTFLAIPNNGMITRYFLFRLYEKAIAAYRLHSIEQGNTQNSTK